MSKDQSLSKELMTILEKDLDWDELEAARVMVESESDMFEAIYKWTLLSARGVDKEADAQLLASLRGTYESILTHISEQLKKETEDYFEEHA